MVITRENAVHALLYLVVSLLGLALVFYSLGAPFAAALEVIIYAGAIMVLFIFVVMMLHVGKESVDQEKRWLNPSMWIGPVILAIALLGETGYMIFSGGVEEQTMRYVGPKLVGLALYGPYVIGVELAAILLLAGVAGAYHLGKEKTVVTHRFLKDNK